MAPDNWLYHYQTLITGILAIVVAAVTVHYLRIQIRQTAQQLEHAEKLQAEQRNRQLRAFRAGLPIALTRIHQYSNQCARVLLEILKVQPSDDHDVVGPYPNRLMPASPTYPAEAFKVLQSTIEFADAEDAEKLAKAIAYSQIQHSRFSSLYSRVFEGGDRDFVVTRSSVLHAVRDAVGMRLHADAMYDYGRETELHIHDLGDAERAAEALLLLREGNRAAQFVREHWPPDFPRKMSAV